MFLRLKFCDEQHNAPNIRTQRILPAISKPHKFAFFVSTFVLLFPSVFQLLVGGQSVFSCAKLNWLRGHAIFFRCTFILVFLIYIFEVLVFPTFSHNWFWVVGTCVYKIMIFIPVSEFCFFPSVPEWFDAYFQHCCIDVIFGSSAFMLCA